ncbi:MAG: TetR family transcriptional regulator [Pseudomonadota bacterium]
MSLPFQRARSPEHKLQRRQVILDSAARVLARKGLADTSLNAIAQEAGVVKSGLYRYFESREEILLRLLISDLEAMVETLEETVTGPTPVEDLAGLVADGFAQRPQLCLLTSATASTLEHNITGDTLRDVKRQLLAIAARTATALSRGAPHLSVEANTQAIRMIFALVAGLYPMTTPAPHVAKILEEPEFEGLKADFHTSLRFATISMFAGIAAAGAAQAES